MHSNITHLANLFKGVRDVREAMGQYALSPNMSTPNLWDLQYAFEQTYNVRIQKVMIHSVGNDLVRGIFLRKSDDVTILIDSGCPDHWERYVFVKEMCHLILKDPEYMTVDPSDLIEMMIFEHTNPKEGEAPLDLVSDLWTPYAAHELLFPSDIRTAARARLDAGESTIFTLAQQHEVPEHVIELTLSPAYMKTCDLAWSLVHGDSRR
jgi:hypothetical protein